MPLSPALADWLNAEGHDAVHASQRGFNRATDQVVIDFGRSEGRIVITADLDYPRILALSNSDKPGVILFRGGEWSQHETEVRLQAALSALTSDQLEASIVVIEKSRIRRRALPLS